MALVMSRYLLAMTLRPSTSGRTSWPLLTLDRPCDLRWCTGRLSADFCWTTSPVISMSSFPLFRRPSRTKVLATRSLPSRPEDQIGLKYKWFIAGGLLEQETDRARAGRADNGIATDFGPQRQAPERTDQTGNFFRRMELLARARNRPDPHSSGHLVAGNAQARIGPLDRPAVAPQMLPK